MTTTEGQTEERAVPLVTRLKDLAWEVEQPRPRLRESDPGTLRAAAREIERLREEVEALRLKPGQYVVEIRIPEVGEWVMFPSNSIHRIALPATLAWPVIVRGGAT